MSFLQKLKSTYQQKEERQTEPQGDQQRAVELFNQNEQFILQNKERFEKYEDDQKKRRQEYLDKRQYKLSRNTDHKTQLDQETQQQLVKWLIRNNQFMNSQLKIMKAAYNKKLTIQQLTFESTIYEVRTRVETTIKTMCKEFIKNFQTKIDQIYSSLQQSITESVFLMIQDNSKNQIDPVFIKQAIVRYLAALSKQTFEEVLKIFQTEIFSLLRGSFKKIEEHFLSERGETGLCLNELMKRLQDDVRLVEQRLKESVAQITQNNQNQKLDIVRDMQQKYMRYFGGPSVILQE